MAAVGTATHYHADYVSPYWAPSLVKVRQIGAHIFYRWPGNAGRVEAFTGAYAGGETRISEAVLSGRAARPIPDAPAPGTTTGLHGLAGVRTVAMVGADGKTTNRVQGSFVLAGGGATTPAPQPSLYGRRVATPDDIARINALLDQRFGAAPGTKPAEAPTAAASAPPAPAPQAG
jgi:hypothetical protein